MSDTIVRDVTVSSHPASGPKHGQTARAKRKPWLLQVAAMIGIGALLYSSAADWVSTIGHNAEVSGYTSAVQEISAPERETKLAAAREYNSKMPQGMLRDPYSMPLDENEQTIAYSAYEEVLRVSDNGVIAQLGYPKLGIGLPVYHGTSDPVLRRGAGHIYGSSLPIGGPGTHSVLTSHSGLLNAALFSPLKKAQLGDTFTINVLGETLYYQVDQIETVLPEQTEGLRIVGGEDYVTLITCTPTGINSHRLLVRGVRVPAPTDASGSLIAGDGKTLGFPWWAVGFLGGSAAVAYLLFVPPRPRKKSHTGSVRADTVSKSNGARFENKS